MVWGCWPIVLVTKQTMSFHTPVYLIKPHLAAVVTRPNEAHISTVDRILLFLFGVRTLKTGIFKEKGRVYPPPSTPQPAAILIQPFRSFAGLFVFIKR